MNNFFIAQCALLLLAFNGNMVGMCHVTRKLTSKSCRAYSVTPTLNNAPETNNKDSENKQEYYILRSTHYDEKDKMAYYKQWQQRS